MLRLGLLLGTALLSARFAGAREYRGGDGIPWEPGIADIPYYGTEDDRFFTEAEREAVAAMAARLIPSDEDGPGATEAGVADFIDRQLAGFFGRGQRWYMQGPWPEGLATQGYQVRHTPAELYREAIAAIDAHCAQQFGGRVFAALEPHEQDAVLTGIEEEEITFETVSGTTFFTLLRENTIEGFFCDPLYGGNRGMVGWRYVGFPGARYDYRDFLAHGGARIEIEPVGLYGRPEWN